jgi:putative ABC transport system substrate-binding protein
MRRCEFITLLGGAAAARPVAARAQQPRLPVIGFLHPASQCVYNLNGFRQGLREAGFAEGQNLAVEYRWADNEPDRLPELVADLIRRRLQIIVTLSSGLAVQTAKAATSTIPIVFGNGVEPVQAGLSPA